MFRCLILVIGKIYNKLSIAVQQCRSKYILSCLKSCGESVHIDMNCQFINSENISIGEHVYIGDNARLMASNAAIIIGNHVMIAPNCTIITGDHRINVIGKYMDQVTEKESHNDSSVVISDDVWIGYGSTILKGVTIGKGSVIGAGSIITKDVPPYSICYTKAETIIKKRFSNEEITNHERALCNN